MLYASPVSTMALVILVVLWEIYESILCLDPPTFRE